MIEEEDSDR
jgi:hypothetical protein